MSATAPPTGDAGPRRGILISLEGCDGCGKTTQAHLLCERLAAGGLPVGTLAAPSAPVREPGGTPVGEAIRELLLHASDAPDPWAEALLYAAARAELVAQVLLPGLAAGRVLVLDRFIDSSLAYQGHARGLGVDEVLRVNQPGLRGLLPDLTVVLDADPSVSLGRSGDSPDRIESEGLGLQRAVRQGFLVIAGRFPERVRVIDGRRSLEAVADDVFAAVTAIVEGARARAV
jgi:dTMP kinase